MLRLLRSQGLSTGQLSVVFTGLIVPRLLYALPTWGVFASAADIGRIAFPITLPESTATI